MSLRRVLQSLTVLLIMSGLFPNATRLSADIILNGDFESGDLSGWTVTTQAGSGGAFSTDDIDLATPLSGFPTVGPNSGSYYAVSDQTGPTAAALWQEFNIAGPSPLVTLTFDLFVNDWSANPGANDPAGLDYSVVPPNQHSRVDILRAGADPLSTVPGDILLNSYLGVDPNDPALTLNSYTTYSFDVTNIVGSGGTYMLRFSQVNNEAVLNMGVDNISIQATSVPEPSTVTLLLTAFSSLMGLSHHRRRTTPRNAQ